MNDWLCAVDDGLTQRLRCCTLCGKAPVTFWGIVGVRGLAIAYMQCQGCRAKDRDSKQVEELLERRYGTGADDSQ